MVDTSDEWIMTRIGIKERHILKEPGKGASELGAEAVRRLLEKTNTKPEEIDLVVCATVTPDHQFPATASIISDKVGIISDIIYGPDQRTQINANTRNVVFTVYAPTGIDEQLVTRHLQDMRDYVLIIAPQAQVELLQVFGGE